LQECILEYITLWDLEDQFREWIIKDNIFCNTLVDRIVTGFPKKNIDTIFESIGYTDKLIVDAEPYHLFVIQGPESVKKELPFEKTKLNVKFTEDLTSYRQIKVRILNGAHTAMVPLGLLMGVETVGQFVKNNKLKQWLVELIKEEIIPTLDYPEELLTKYTADVLDRFRNPFIEHKLIDISLNSISKFRVRLLPSLHAYYDQHAKLPPKIVKAFAALIGLYIHNSQFDTIPLRDDPQLVGRFKRIGKRFWKDTSEIKVMLADVLSIKSFWGQDLNEIEGLVDALAESFKSLDLLQDDLEWSDN